jgi:hypothetical protein
MTMFWLQSKISMWIQKDDIASSYVFLKIGACQMMCLKIRCIKKIHIGIISIFSVKYFSIMFYFRIHFSFKISHFYMDFFDKVYVYPFK